MTVKILRWTARILSSIIFLFWGYMFLADVFETIVHKNANTLDFKSFTYLALMVITILSLVLAWKWEIVGGTISLIAFVLNVIINPEIIGVFFHLILPLLSIAYIIAWEMSRKTNMSHIKDPKD